MAKPFDTTLKHLIEAYPRDWLQLAGGAELQLDRIVAKMEEEYSTVPDTAEQSSPWAASFVLMGHRPSRDTAETLFRGVLTMEESTTYQAIIEKGISKGFSLGKVEGRVETARELLIDLGSRSFGNPPPAVLAFINSVSDYSHLKRLVEQIMVVKNWEGLLNANRPNSENGA